MKLSRVLLVLVSTMAVGTTALARAPEREHSRDELAIEKQFSIEKLKKLDLSAEQREKLKDLRQKHKDDVQKLCEELKVVKRAFKDALRSKAGKEEVMRAFDSMMAKKIEVGKARMAGLLEAREVLTPEQREMLFENKEE
jgi:Spy/CpxP family protein refolding chaperone